MSTQHAKTVLSLVNSAPIRGTDAEHVVQVKQWLLAIATGKLVVGTPVPETPVPETPAPQTESTQ